MARLKKELVEERERIAISMFAQKATVEQVQDELVKKHGMKMALPRLNELQTKAFVPLTSTLTKEPGLIIKGISPEVPGKPTPIVQEALNSAVTFCAWTWPMPEPMPDSARKHLYTTTYRQLNDMVAEFKDEGLTIPTNVQSRLDAILFAHNSIIANYLAKKAAEYMEIHILALKANGELEGELTYDKAQKKIQSLSSLATWLENNDKDSERIRAKIAEIKSKF